MKNKFIQILIAILPLMVFAQEWTIELPKNVNLIKMTDAGVAIVGTDDALYGIDETGKILWNNEKLKKVDATRVEVLSGSELVFVSDIGLLARNRVLNVRTGVEYANKNLPGVKTNIFAARVIHGTNQLWVSPDFNSVEVWDIIDNSLLYTISKDQLPFKLSTNTMASLTSTFAGTQPITYIGTKDAILHLTTAHLGRYNLITGEAIWKFDWKPFKIKPDKGFMASQPSRGFSIMKIDESAQTLYFPFMDQLIAIDINNGQSKWDLKKGGQTGKVRDMYILDNEILILTTNGLQLVDKVTGNLKWDKALKVKEAGLAILLKGKDHFYTVSKGTIVQIDLKKKTAKPLTEKIKFSGQEFFTSLEEIDNVIVMSSDQNVVAVDKKSGNIVHQTYLKAPGQGVVAIAQNMALAAVAAAATMNSYNLNSQGANTTGMSTANTVAYHQYTPKMIEAGGSATTSNNKTMYISTKFKDADALGFGVAKVDKATGEIQDKIVIGDRDPVYDVNHKDGLIFFKSGKKSISMKKVK